MTPSASVPVPTIFATDIGSDIDDTWALAQLLRSPELDLRFVLTEHGEPEFRAKVAAKLLEAAGRSDVAIGLGKESPASAEVHRHQAPWIKDYALENYPGKVRLNGVQALIDCVMETDGIVTIIAVAPVSGLAEAIGREPALAARCRLVGMFGSFKLGYGGLPPRSAETNVRVDPQALRKVLDTNWHQVVLAPIDTCGEVSLDELNYQEIWRSTDDPLLRAVIENYRIWAPRVPWMDCDYFATRSSTLFDCVAVYLAYAETFLEFDEISFEITDNGFTRPVAGGPYSARVALRWKDRRAFEVHLTRRLLGRE